MIAEIRERLGIELERLSRQLTDELATEIVGPGENRFVQEERRVLQKQIRRLGQLVAGLVQLDSDVLDFDRVGFGSAVVLRNLDDGQHVSYTLITGDVLDLAENEVSLGSPVGQALLGRKAGHRVVVHTPGGRQRYQIVSLTTLPQRLGMQPMACA